MSESDIQVFLDSKIGACQNGLCLNVLRQDTYSIPQDRTICSEYVGASNELVSRIIYKVQAACKISAKVLLVTLQKEMGLITSKAPSQWSLNHAMGYACPDTAPCNSDKAGFFNQLYSAAWQFKRYSTPTPWGNFQPGIRAIAYSPNSSCGSSQVNILNNATAALYNYTPYQPNAAALANLSGTGDSCSSYGNRNFWVFYTSWFSSQGSQAIDQAYQQSGSETGVLGTIVSSDFCPQSATTCSAKYEGGSIYWRQGIGAKLVLNPIDQLFRSMAPSMIWPTGDPVQESAAPGGQSQRFQGANAYTSELGTYAVYGGIRTEFDRTGGPAGTLGWPTAGDECGLVGGGCLQRFQNGVIYYSSLGTFSLSSSANTAYEAVLGPRGVLGYPIAQAIESTSNGSGTIYKFQSGNIFESAAGSFPVYGSMLSLYNSRGGVQSNLGWPVSDRVCTPIDGCIQQFQFGSLQIDAISEFASPRQVSLGPAIGPRTEEPAAPGGASLKYKNATVYTFALGTFAVYGVFRTEYDRLGGPAGALGWPTASDQCGLTGGGCTQTFQNGTMFYSPATGTSTVFNPLLSEYLNGGGINGPLGYPTAQMACDATSCSQQFEHGVITQATTK